MATELKFLIDGADRGQPLNPEEFSITINEDDSIGLRVVSFNNDMNFGGGVYSYLFGKLTENGYCELVNVEVQYKCKNGWAKLVDGYIIVTESVFDYDTCQVKTKIYDETFSTRINNNKSIPFSLSINQTKNLQPVTPPARRLIKIFNPANPTSVLESGIGVSVYDAFKHLIACMSDNLIDFASDLFFTFPDDTNTVCITNGRSIRTNTDNDIVVSFESLYADLRNKYNLGMGFIKQANGRPLLRIEPIEYFNQLNPSANLYDQAGIELKFDTSRLYASVEFGSNPMLEQGDSSSQNDPPQALTFAQTPFRGFREEIFGFTGECNTANVLRLKTDKLIFDTNVIEDIFRFNNDSYDLDNIILQVKYVSSVTPFFETLAFDPYNIGQSVFNGDFTNQGVSTAWLNGFPNSLFSFLQEGFDPADTNAVVEISDTQNENFQTDTIGLYFSQFNGDFIDFLDEVTDPNNVFSGEQYTVPFAGIYTFNAQLIRNPVGDPLVGNVTIHAAIRHFSPNDDEIQLYVGSDVTQNESSFSICNVSASIVCNVGDLIRVDMFARTQSGINVPISIRDDFGEQSSFFNGIGEPFDPEDLQPVNIDDVRAYLYKFNRHLTMDEINAITSNTSNPIKFGRKADPLAVISGYIKTINIESVMRKSASIELKSNLLLQ